jgi:hypothetical protein
MTYLSKCEKQILRHLDTIRQSETPKIPDPRTFEQVVSDLAKQLKCEPDKCQVLMNDLIRRRFAELPELGWPPRYRPRITDKGIQVLLPWWRRRQIAVGTSILITVTTSMLTGTIVWLITRFLAQRLFGRQSSTATTWQSGYRSSLPRTMQDRHPFVKGRLSFSGRQQRRLR